MGKITGFMEYQRLEEAAEAPQSRKQHWREFVVHLTDEQATVQGARCMDCGIPFCNHGCPVNNIIPDFNDLVYRGDWKAALDVLHSTNNFPEFTGRVCPAPCEAACTLNIEDVPVGIKSIEHKIIDKGWEEGWVVPQPPRVKTGRKVAVVGSGPAGLVGRAATRARRPRRDRVREERSHRRTAALRHSRLQDGEVAHRPARRTDGGRGRHLPHRRPGQQGQAQRRRHQLGDGDDRSGATAARVRCRRAVGRCGAVARPAGAGPRTEGRALRNGVPAAAEQDRGRRQGEGADPRHRQACRRHRRRRHRLGLCRHVEPAWRQVGHAVRTAAAAPGQGEQGTHVAVLAREAAHVQLARRRRRARLGGDHQALRGRRQGQRARAGGGAGRMAEGTRSPVR